MTGLVDIPYVLACKIWEAWEDEQDNAWTWYADRYEAHWAATPYQYNGEQVMMLLDGNMRHATRSSVEAVYGPLTEVPHCTTCGDYLFYRDGVCHSLMCTQT